MVFKLDANTWSAIGSVVNAAVVIVLAVINVLYLKAALRQANAAESQANAALESVRLLLRSNKLQTERDEKKIVHCLGDISAELDALSEANMKGDSWSGPLVPKDFGESQTLFLSLYPDLDADLQDFLSHLRKVADSINTHNWNRDASGYVSGLNLNNVLTSNVNAARENLRTLLNKLRARSPNSSAFIAW